MGELSWQAALVSYLMPAKSTRCSRPAEDRTCLTGELSWHAAFAELLTASHVNEVQPACRGQNSVGRELIGRQSLMGELSWHAALAELLTASQVNEVQPACRGGLLGRQRSLR
eukprot:1150661-Pelagomonas_calceolata.AAC.1